MANSTVENRVNLLWEQPRQFGMERNPKHLWLEEVAPDRGILTSDMVTINDDFRLRPTPVGISFKNPTVVSTVSATRCVDRICSGYNDDLYNKIMGRFANIDELGYPRMEMDFPLGGGTEHASTLGNVTVHHLVDHELIDLLYTGNKKSFDLTLLDVRTHVGRYHPNASINEQNHDREVVNPQTDILYGLAQESPYRKPRSSCGAVVGFIKKYNPNNELHKRLMEDITRGNRENYDLLKNGILSDEGVDITPVVGSAILSLQGLYNLIKHIPQHLHERSVVHVTASTQVNLAGADHSQILLARATVFNQEVYIQGLGTDASLYAGRFVDHHGEKRLVLSYSGQELTNFPVNEQIFQLTDNQNQEN